MQPHHPDCAPAERAVRVEDSERGAPSGGAEPCRVPGGGLRSFRQQCARCALEGAWRRQDSGLQRLELRAAQRGDVRQAVERPGIKTGFETPKRKRQVARPELRAGNVTARQCFWGGVVGLTELESVTSCVSSRRSNQLSYKPTIFSIVADGQAIWRGESDPGVHDAEVRVEAIRPQKRSNPSVPVRKAPSAFVGQVFNLRPVSNRPPASVRQCRKGGLQARRRVETCPTKHRRIHFHAATWKWAWRRFACSRDGTRA